MSLTRKALPTGKKYTVFRLRTEVVSACRKPDPFPCRLRPKHLARGEEDDNDEGWEMSIGEKETFEQEYTQARPGDHLLTSFQCDLCNFRNIVEKKKNILDTSRVASWSHGLIVCETCLRQSEQRASLELTAKGEGLIPFSSFSKLYPTGARRCIDNAMKVMGQSPDTSRT